MIWLTYRSWVHMMRSMALRHKPVNENGDSQMSEAQASRQAGAAAQADPSRRTIHIVLHEAKDTVGVAVVEGIRAGTQLNAWIMDEDEIVTVPAKQEIPIGHKVALKDMKV